VLDGSKALLQRAQGAHSDPAWWHERAGLSLLQQKAQMLRAAAPAAADTTAAASVQVEAKATRTPPNCIIH